LNIIKKSYEKFFDNYQCIYAYTVFLLSPLSFFPQVMNCSLGLKVGADASLSLVRSRLQGDEETSGDILLLQPPGPEWSIEANESRCSVVDSNVSHIIYQDQKEVIFFTVHVAITFRFSVLQSVFRIRRDPNPFGKLGGIQSRSLSKRKAGSSCASK
jgi:hypothetical protein